MKCWLAHWLLKSHGALLARLEHLPFVTTNGCAYQFNTCEVARQAGATLITFGKHRIDPDQVLAAGIEAEVLVFQFSNRRLLYFEALSF
jgi:hypothetical protein